MRKLQLLLLAIFASGSIAAINYRIIGRIKSPPTIAVAAVPRDAPGLAQATRYRLDATHSTFIAHARPGGLLWFKGHEHLVGIRDFSGEAELTAGSITPASLTITARTASMAETSPAFTEPQKQIINRELREIVLLPDKFPEIIFRSTAITGKTIAAGQYDLKITGDLSLLGVTRQIAIPTKVTITGGEMQAVGEFYVDRSDFKVKATSAVHGLVRIRNKLKFTFDIRGNED
jgi:polyisoprenoid-binding protein YceI